METVTKRLYEAMFLVDSAEAAADWEGINEVIKNILERVEAEIVSIKKWDECKLAYAINHKGRGTYLLCYFKSEAEKIAEIEREVQLTERIMRVLILNAEHMTQEDLEKDTPVMRAESRVKEAEEREAAAREAEAAAKALEPEPEPETSEVEVLEDKTETEKEDSSEELAESVVVEDEELQQDEESAPAETEKTDESIDS